MNFRSTVFVTLAMGTLLPLYGQTAPPFAHHHHVVFPSTTSRSGTQPVGVTPYQMNGIYNFYDIDYYCDYGPGSGQVIAIVDAYDDPTAESDLGVFDSEFDIPTCTTANGCFNKVYSTGTKPPTNSNWSVEIALDVEWAHAMAPLANIVLVEAPSASTTDLLKAVQVAIQHGATIVSMSWGASEYAAETTSDGVFQVGVQQNNIGFVAAAGDAGHGVEYPSASPFVIGVGGTTLSAEAFQYDGEVVWNTKAGATGGGVSAYESEPTWQLPFQTQGHRGVPDVAYDADPATGVAVYSTLGEGGQKGWMQIGGTSVGTPQIAALMAIANSIRSYQDQSRLLLPAALYANSGIWHDVTVGNNGKCGTLCNAGAGYDFTTGLGTPIANYVVAALSDNCY